MLSFEIKCVCGYEFRISVDQDRIQDDAINKLVAMVDRTQKDHLDCVKIARSSPEIGSVNVVNGYEKVTHVCKECGDTMLVGCMNKGCKERMGDRR